MAIDDVPVIDWPAIRQFRVRVYGGNVCRQFTGMRRPIHPLDVKSGQRAAWTGGLQQRADLNV